MDDLTFPFQLVADLADLGSSIKMPFSSDDKPAIEKTDEPNNDEKQLVDFVNLLVNEEEFEREYSFKLQDHIAECEEFVAFLRDKVKHIRSCNRKTGKL